jgi:hypothetical protein
MKRAASTFGLMVANHRATFWSGCNRGSMRLQREPMVVAITHLGVIRVVMAAAYDWDMLGKPPVKIRPATAHLFDIAPGSIRVCQMNIPLQAGE